MRQRLISRSPDLKKLRDEGYEVNVDSGYLIITHVPYVTERREVAYGTLVSDLTLNGDITVRPQDHVVKFAGETPCDRDGVPLDRVINSHLNQAITSELTVTHLFSSKPPAGYAHYFEKMTTYISILGAPAQAIDPTATATTFPVVQDDDAESVFKYMDTASSRAGITAVTEKLQLGKVAIIGLGGSGVYILDFVAKTPVREIHLWDDDLFLQHNAFRAPGAASVEELRVAQCKAVHWQAQYARMRHGIVAHEGFLDASNVSELQGMDFVFLSLSSGEAKRLTIPKLEAWAIPFVDVGMGLYEADGALAGQLRTTTSTDAQRDHVHTKKRIPFTDGETDDEYSQNVQIVELNALNAALAVVRWKKLFGFYHDLEHEHFSVYTIDGNHVLNEDQA